MVDNKSPQELVKESLELLPLETQAEMFAEYKKLLEADFADFYGAFPLYIGPDAYNLKIWQDIANRLKVLGSGNRYEFVFLSGEGAFLSLCSVLGRMEADSQKGWVTKNCQVPETLLATTLAYAYNRKNPILKKHVGSANPYAGIKHDSAAFLSWASPSTLPATWHYNGFRTRLCRYLAHRIQKQIKLVQSAVTSNS